MQHFKILFAFLILGFVCAVILTIVLIVSFLLNTLYLEPELKEAANFDRWGILALLAAIVSVGMAIVCAYSGGVIYRFLSGSRNSVVGQMIYILGIVSQVTRCRGFYCCVYRAILYTGQTLFLVF